jgi:branched-chain amino acid transport system permease protein
LLTLVACALSVGALWRIVGSPFGQALRASRDSPLRAEAIGIDVRAQQWAAFAIAGTFAGVAGALYAFSKGSISPETLSVPRSVDALVMVLLGGVQTLAGPIWGAALFTWLEDSVSREVAYWRAGIGAVILLLVLALPHGIGGLLGRWSSR